MITRRKRLNKVQVTFVPPARDEPVFVAGSFNDWQPEQCKRARDGSLRATITASPGETLEFRYVTASGEWFDDEGADEHVWNEHGTQNGLLHL